MNIGFLTEDLRISSRKLAAVTLLTSGTLAWFFLLNLYQLNLFRTLTLNDPLWDYYNIGQILFYGSAIFWAIIGSFFGGKINRRKLLLSWISLGTFSTILLTLFQGTIFAAMFSLLLGMSLGLGLPSSMALIADYTAVEERARVSGIIILGTFVIAFVTMAATRILNLGILGAILLFAVIRSISFFALVFDKCEGQEQKVAEKPRLPSTAYREFFFYLFPWVMFSIAAGLAWNLIPQTPEYETAVSIGSALRYVCIAVFGLVAGVAADRFGRKQPIIIGLLMLVVSFALLGVNMSTTSVLIYLTASGVAWGSLFVIFLTVPGDLSVSGSREKFYGMGYILPLAILFGLSAVPGWVAFAGFSASSLALIFSVILFLSIIPILRAKETLSGQKIRERKMKEHVKKIGKLVQESKKASSRET